MYFSHFLYIVSPYKEFHDKNGNSLLNTLIYIALIAGLTCGGNTILYLYYLTSIYRIKAINTFFLQCHSFWINYLPQEVMMVLYHCFWLPHPSHLVFITSGGDQKKVSLFCFFKLFILYWDIAD